MTAFTHYHTLWNSELVPMFRRNVLYPSSGCKTSHDHTSSTPAVKIRAVRVFLYAQSACACLQRAKAEWLRAFPEVRLFLTRRLQAVITERELRGAD